MSVHLFENPTITAGQNSDSCINASGIRFNANWVYDILQNGSEEEFRKLITSSTDDRKSVFSNPNASFVLDGIDKRGITIAAERGFLSIVQSLVEQGAVIQKTSGTSGGRAFHDVRKGDEFCDDVMRAAVIGGHVGIVKYLLEQKAIPWGTADHLSAYNNSRQRDGKDSLRQTFLARAAYEGFEEIVALLIQYGDSIHPEKIYRANKVWEQSIIESDAYQHYQKNQLELNPPQEMRDQALESLRLVLDHTFGYQAYFGLNDIPKVDLSGMNLIGIETPRTEKITREMLISKGFIGAEGAIMTLEDIEKIEDPIRREALMARAQAYLSNG